MVNKHKKMCLPLLVIRQTQIKTTTHPPEWLKLERLTPPNADKVMEQVELSHTLLGNVKWYHPLEKRSGRFLIKLKIYPLYNLAIPLLHIYPREMKISLHKGSCMVIFTVLHFFSQLYNSLKLQIAQVGKSEQ